MQRTADGKIEAVALSVDHKPERPDERKRILNSNGRVEACKGMNGEDIGPPRVWLRNQDVPGLAMTRSIGDLVAASVGVSCRPEIQLTELTGDDLFIILASDGVWFVFFFFSPGFGKRFCSSGDSGNLSRARRPCQSLHHTSLILPTHVVSLSMNQPNAGVRRRRSSMIPPALSLPCEFPPRNFPPFHTLCISALLLCPANMCDFCVAKIASLQRIPQRTPLPPLFASLTPQTASRVTSTKHLIAFYVDSSAF